MQEGAFFLGNEWNELKMRYFQSLRVSTIRECKCKWEIRCWVLHRIIIQSGFPNFSWAGTLITWFDYTDSLTKIYIFLWVIPFLVTRITVPLKSIFIFFTHEKWLTKLTLKILTFSENICFKLSRLNFIENKTWHKTWSKLATERFKTSTIVIKLLP